MLNKIPTVEEFFKKYSDNTSLSEGHYDYLVEKDSFKEAIIEFAKLHVESALKEASEKANLYLHNPGWKHSSDIKTVKCHNYDASINKDSILNAYPLELIK